MKIVLALFVGMLWGIVPCLVNYKLGLFYAKKSTVDALNAYNRYSRLINLAAFLVVFLLRNIVPLHTAAMLFGVALSLSTLGIYLTVKITNKK